MELQEVERAENSLSSLHSCFPGCSVYFSLRYGDFVVERNPYIVRVNESQISLNSYNLCYKSKIKRCVVIEPKIQLAGRNISIFSYDILYSGSGRGFVKIVANDLGSKKLVFKNANITISYAGDNFTIYVDSLYITIEKVMLYATI